MSQTWGLLAVKVRKMSAAEVWLPYLKIHVGINKVIMFLTPNQLQILKGLLLYQQPPMLLCFW